MTMTRTLTLRRIGNSIGATFPRDLLERHGLTEASTVHVVDTPDGLLLTPYDPDFGEAMAISERVSNQYRNALRELSR